MDDKNNKNHVNVTQSRHSKMNFIDKKGDNGVSMFDLVYSAFGMLFQKTRLTKEKIDHNQKKSQVDIFDIQTSSEKSEQEARKAAQNHEKDIEYQQEIMSQSQKEKKRIDELNKQLEEQNKQLQEQNKQREESKEQEARERAQSEGINNEQSQTSESGVFVIGSSSNIDEWDTFINNAEANGTTGGTTIGSGTDIGDAFNQGSKSGYTLHSNSESGLEATSGGTTLPSLTAGIVTMVAASELFGDLDKAKKEAEENLENVKNLFKKNKQETKADEQKEVKHFDHTLSKDNEASDSYDNKDSVINALQSEIQDFDNESTTTRSNIPGTSPSDPPGPPGGPPGGPPSDFGNNTSIGMVKKDGDPNSDIFDVSSTEFTIEQFKSDSGITAQTYALSQGASAVISSIEQNSGLQYDETGRAIKKVGTMGIPAVQAVAMASSAAMLTYTATKELQDNLEAAKQIYDARLNNRIDENGNLINEQGEVLNIAVPDQKVYKDLGFIKDGETLNAIDINNPEVLNKMAVNATSYLVNEGILEQGFVNNTANENDPSRGLLKKNAISQSQLDRQQQQINHEVNRLTRQYQELLKDTTRYRNEIAIVGKELEKAKRAQLSINVINSQRKLVKASELAGRSHGTIKNLTKFRLLTLGDDDSLFNSGFQTIRPTYMILKRNVLNKNNISKLRKIGARGMNMAKIYGHKATAKMMSINAIKALKTKIKSGMLYAMQSARSVIAGNAALNAAVKTGAAVVKGTAGTVINGANQVKRVNRTVKNVKKVLRNDLRLASKNARRAIGHTLAEKLRLGVLSKKLAPVKNLAGNMIRFLGSTKLGKVIAQVLNKLAALIPGAKIVMLVCAVLLVIFVCCCTGGVSFDSYTQSSAFFVGKEGTAINDPNESLASEVMVNMDVWFTRNYDSICRKGLESYLEENPTVSPFDFNNVNFEEGKVSIISRNDASKAARITSINNDGKKDIAINQPGDGIDTSVFSKSENRIQKYVYNKHKKAKNSIYFVSIDRQLQYDLVNKNYELANNRICEIDLKKPSPDEDEDDNSLYMKTTNADSNGTLFENNKEIIAMASTLMQNDFTLQSEQEGGEETAETEDDSTSAITNEVDFKVYCYNLWLNSHYCSISEDFKPNNTDKNIFENIAAWFAGDRSTDSSIVDDNYRDAAYGQYIQLDRLGFVSDSSARNLIAPLDRNSATVDRLHYLSTPLCVGGGSSISGSKIKTEGSDVPITAGLGSSGTYAYVFADQLRLLSGESLSSTEKGSIPSSIASSSISDVTPEYIVPQQKNISGSPADKKEVGEMTDNKGNSVKKLDGSKFVTKELYASDQGIANKAKTKTNGQHFDVDNFTKAQDNLLDGVIDVYKQFSETFGLNLSGDKNSGFSTSYNKDSVKAVTSCAEPMINDNYTELQSLNNEIKEETYEKAISDENKYIKYVIHEENIPDKYAVHKFDKYFMEGTNNNRGNSYTSSNYSGAANGGTTLNDINNAYTLTYYTYTYINNQYIIDDLNTAKTEVKGAKVDDNTIVQYKANGTKSFTASVSGLSTSINCNVLSPGTYVNVMYVTAYKYKRDDKGNIVCDANGVAQTEAYPNTIPVLNTAYTGPSTTPKNYYQAYCIYKFQNAQKPTSQLVIKSSSIIRMFLQCNGHTQICIEPVILTFNGSVTMFDVDGMLNENNTEVAAKSLPATSSLRQTILKRKAAEYQKKVFEDTKINDVDSAIVLSMIENEPATEQEETTEAPADGTTEQPKEEKASLNAELWNAETSVGKENVMNAVTMVAESWESTVGLSWDKLSEKSDSIAKGEDSGSYCSTDNTNHKFVDNDDFPNYSQSRLSAAELNKKIIPTQSTYKDTPNASGSYDIDVIGMMDYIGYIKAETYNAVASSTVVYNPSYETSETANYDISENVYDESGNIISATTKNPQRLTIHPGNYTLNGQAFNLDDEVGKWKDSTNEAEKKKYEIYQNRISRASRALSYVGTIGYSKTARHYFSSTGNPLKLNWKETDCGLVYKTDETGFAAYIIGDDPRYVSADELRRINPSQIYKNGANGETVTLIGKKEDSNTGSTENTEITDIDKDKDKKEETREPKELVAKMYSLSSQPSNAKLSPGDLIYTKQKVYVYLYTTADNVIKTAVCTNMEGYSKLGPGGVIIKSFNLSDLTSKNAVYIHIDKDMVDDTTYRDTSFWLAKDDVKWSTYNTDNISTSEIPIAGDNSSWLAACNTMGQYFIKNIRNYDQGAWTPCSLIGGTSVRHDCSSYVSACLYYMYPSIFNKSDVRCNSTNYAKTGALASKLKSAGFVWVSANDVKKSGGIQAGDITVDIDAHVEIIASVSGNNIMKYSWGDAYPELPTKSKAPNPVSYMNFGHTYDGVWRKVSDEADKKQNNSKTEKKTETTEQEQNTTE